MARAATAGYGAWLAAREAGEFRLLPRRAGPPDRAAARVRRLLPGRRAPLRRPARRLRARHDPRRGPAAVRRSWSRAWSRSIAGAATDADQDEVLGGDFPVDAQRALLAAVLPELGYDPQSWRLDDAPHPFAQSPGPGRRPPHHPLPHRRPRLLVLQRPARVRPRALRRQLRRRRCAARRCTTARRSASTSPRAGCGRTSSAAAGRSAPGCSRGCSSTCRSSSARWTTRRCTAG